MLVEYLLDWSQDLKSKIDNNVSAGKFAVADLKELERIKAKVLHGWTGEAIKLGKCVILTLHCNYSYYSTRNVKQKKRLNQSKKVISKCNKKQVSAVKYCIMCALRPLICMHVFVRFYKCLIIIYLFI